MFCVSRSQNAQRVDQRDGTRVVHRSKSTTTTEKRIRACTGIVSYCCPCARARVHADGVSVVMAVVVVGIDVGLSQHASATSFARVRPMSPRYIHSNMVVRTRERSCSSASNNASREHALAHKHGPYIIARRASAALSARAQASSQHLYTLIIIRAIFEIIYGNVSVVPVAGVLHAARDVSCVFVGVRALADGLVHCRQACACLRVYA